MEEGGTEKKPQSQGAFLLQFFLGLLFSSYLYGIVFFGTRVVQPFFALAGNPVVAAFGAGFAFFVASRPFVRITGGYVFFEHIAFMAIFAWIGSSVTGNGFFSTKGTGTFVRNLSIWAVLLSLIAIFAGNIGAAATMWGLTGTLVIPVMITFPGPWPGVGAVWAARAFGWEILGMGILTLAIYYLLLVHLERKIPTVGAVIVTALTFVGWTISGASFSIIPWISSNIISCASTVGCFPNTFVVPFAITGAITGPPFPGWVTYSFGPSIGVIVFGFLAFAFAYWAVLYGSEIVDAQGMFGPEAAKTVGRSLRARGGTFSMIPDDDEDDEPLKRQRHRRHRRQEDAADALNAFGMRET